MVLSIWMRLQIFKHCFCNALSPMKAVTHLDGKPLDAQICVDLFHTLQLNQIH
jgi:4-amino-4-deoxychorismate lyase